MNVGFIGLGSLGAPIARRLARQGFNLTACDVAPQALEAFDEPGTKREANPVAAAGGAKILGICVRTDEQVEALTADGALFAAMAKGGIVILHSTVAPGLARRLAEQAKRDGVGLIDVGVSGGAPAALEGKLSLFIGGDKDVVDRAMPWLTAIGSTISYLGPSGRGLEGKLLNNLISIANYGMSSAILDVGNKLGFDQEQLSQALMAGSAQSFALKVVPNWVRSREQVPAGMHQNLHDLLKKDVEHARNLPASDPAAMAALLASCEAMLDRLKRAAGGKA